MTKKLLTIHSCPTCSSSMRIVPGLHPIHTDVPGRRHIILKDIVFQCCSVCSFKVLTDESTSVVETLENFYAQEAQLLQLEEEFNEKQSFISRFRRV